MNQDIYVIIEHLQGQVTDISYVMLAAARTLVQETGGRVVAVLLGHKAQGLANNLDANQVLYADHPALEEFTLDAYLKILATVIGKDSPRVVLLGDTSIGADMAGMLSARLNLPLLSHCMKFEIGRKYTLNFYGGKILAEGTLPETTTLVTMIPGGYKAEQGQSNDKPEITPLEIPALENLRISLVKYIEPDSNDVDISKEQVLVSVGRGLQNQADLEIVEALAGVLGCPLSSSRPLVDKGWMPATRLVGKSGKKVKPKLYFAVGISGAPEHVEAIIDAENIIAVNTDSSAPIYDLAKYGTTIDMFDLLPVLTEKIQTIKEG